LFNHFFKEFILEKAVFELLNQFAHLNHQILILIYSRPQFFGSFIPNLGYLDLRLGGYRTCIIRDLFFKAVAR
jgi:hypothetical protein